MLDAPIADWAETTIVEAPLPFVSAADIVLGTGFRDPEQRHGFRRRRLSGQAATWRMRDVTLLPGLGLVFRDGRIVEPTRYCVFPAEERAAIESVAGPRRHLDGRRRFVGLNRLCVNHFHILTQIVPAIAGYAADPGFADGVLLLGEPGQVGHPSLAVLHRALALAGVAVPEVAMVTLSPPLDAPDLTFSSLLTGIDGPSAFCRAVFARIAAAASADSGPDSPTLLYIARADARSRPLRNEDMLVARLARFGVVPVLLSALGLDEQIKLFRGARLVIGPHGAGLANVVFSPPGTVLYELLPHHYVNPCMNLLAQQHGLHHWADIHAAEPRPGVWRHHVPWSVDLDAVERRVAEIFSVYRPLG